MATFIKDPDVLIKEIVARAERRPVPSVEQAQASRDNAQHAIDTDSEDDSSVEPIDTVDCGVTTDFSQCFKLATGRIITDENGAVNFIPAQYVLPPDAPS